MSYNLLIYKDVPAIRFHSIKVFVTQILQPNSRFVRDVSPTLIRCKFDYSKYYFAHISAAFTYKCSILLLLSANFKSRRNSHIHAHLGTHTMISRNISGFPIQFCDIYGGAAKPAKHQLPFSQQQSSSYGYILDSVKLSSSMRVLIATPWSLRLTPCSWPTRCALPACTIPTCEIQFYAQIRLTPSTINNKNYNNNKHENNQQ